MDAQGFLRHVRQIQLASGRRGGGRGAINDKLKYNLEKNAEIQQLLLESTDLRAVVAVNDQVAIYRRFEIMCRYRQVPIPEGLRVAIFRRLTEELAGNSQLLRLKAQRLISVTLYIGTLQEIYDDFPEFHRTISVFHLSTHYPSNPRKILETIRDSIQQMKTDERFEKFWDRPSFFLRAAIHQPKDPIGNMLRIQSAIERLEADERFAELRQIPYVFRHAAIGYMRNPEGHLRKILEKADRISNDPRFVEFRNQRMTVLRAVINNITDPETLLVRKLQALRDDAAQPSSKL